MTLQQLLLTRGFDAADVVSYLESLDEGALRRQVLSLSRSAQRRFFDGAAGVRPISLGHLVPENAAPFAEVVHHGLNTLGVFRDFAKVFCRVPGSDELVGYNLTSALITTAVGPGYFTAGDHSEPGELLVDYLRLPSQKAPHWPPIVPNSHRLSRFVYNGTQDVLRGVSERVTIGRAMKAGKWLPAWFVLLRSP